MPTPKLTHLPAAARVSVPWKNGGGQTQEIAAFPPGASMADFMWRISLATVDRPGAFSVFPGIDRHLTLLEGHLRLDVNCAPHHLEPGDSLRFDGEAPVFGDPLSAPATDLNIMVRRGTFRADVSEVRSGETIELGAGDSILFALEPAHVSGQALAAWDALQIQNASPASFQLSGGPVLVIALVRTP